jgi:hypothetical protein
MTQAQSGLVLSIVSAVFGSVVPYWSNFDNIEK